MNMCTTVECGVMFVPAAVCLANSDYLVDVCIWPVWCCLVKELGYVYTNCTAIMHYVV